MVTDLDGDTGPEAPQQPGFSSPISMAIVRAQASGNGDTIFRFTSAIWGAFVRQPAISSKLGFSAAAASKCGDPTSVGMRA